MTYEVGDAIPLGKHVGDPIDEHSEYAFEHGLVPTFSGTYGYPGIVFGVQGFPKQLLRIPEQSKPVLRAEDYIEITTSQDQIVRLAEWLDNTMTPYEFRRAATLSGVQHSYKVKYSLKFK